MFTVISSQFTEKTSKAGRLTAANREPRTRQGFSLIELMVATSLMALILLVLSQIFISILDLRLESEATNAVAQDGRYLLSRLTHDIHRATDITTPAAPGASGSIMQITIGGVTYTYTLSGNNLTINNGSATDPLNSYATMVSNFSVTRVGNAGGKNTLKLSFRITSAIDTSGPITEARDFQTTIGIR